MNLFAASVVGGVVLVSSVVWQFRQSIWPGRSGRLGEPVVKQFVPTNRTALAGSVNNINQISTSSSWSVIEDEASLRVPIGVSTDTLSQPSHQAPRGIEELSSTEQEPNSVDAEPNRLTELDDAVGEALVETAPAFAASTSDGLGVDGLGVDGLGVDGLGVDGLGVDGLSVDGLGVETDGPIEANGLIDQDLHHSANAHDLEFEQEEDVDDHVLYDSTDEVTDIAPQLTTLWQQIRSWGQGIVRWCMRLLDRN